MFKNATPMRWILLCVLLLTALWFSSIPLGKVLPESPSLFILVQVLLTVIWVGLAIGVVRNIAGLNLKFWQAVTGLAVMALLTGAVILFQIPQPAGSLALMIGASLIGIIVSFILREPAITLPVALMCPLIDYWTVNHGPVKSVITATPEVLEHVSAAIPSAAAPTPLAFIGMGDFLFMALFLMCAVRFKMDPTRTALFFFILVSVALVMVISPLLFQHKGMPGLVVIALGYIAANLKFFKLSRQELLITFLLALSIIGLIVYIELRGH